MSQVVPSKSSTAPSGGGAQVAADLTIFISCAPTNLGDALHLLWHSHAKMQSVVQCASNDLSVCD